MDPKAAWIWGCALYFLLLQVQRSQAIVVVGGGSAGVEMAAEIKTEYPEKEVGWQLALNSQRQASFLSQEHQNLLRAWEVELR